MMKVSLCRARNSTSRSEVYDSGISFWGLFYLLSLVCKSDYKGANKIQDRQECAYLELRLKQSNNLLLDAIFVLTSVQLRLVQRG